MPTIKDDAPYKDFAERLIKLRTDARLSRTELGEKVGISGRAIVNYENGTRIPYGDTCARMAEVFGITTDELLGVQNPQLAMAQAEAMDTMRSISGKKGADRLQEVYQEAENLAGGDLTEDQLLEFSMQMTRMAAIAQQRLSEKYSNRRYQESVKEKRKKTDKTVRALEDAIASLSSDKNSPED